ncbi:hypothetical protein DUI87_09970 [Hirundo rustica rustica]|uniref:HELP domain-containing protein n=1 Tax=Hirundo rustica rustica TaxID=333673 RepID=A0A3M0KMI6_HIRRU|nr:hypothetical protein DUI87_09970 [Hirundo rustica rustica]
MEEGLSCLAAACDPSALAAFCTDDSISAASTSDVQDRLSALELRVQQQEDEITVLKAALADVLRRLAISEDHVASVRKSAPSKGQPSLREAISMSCITNGSTGSRKTSHGSSVSVARKETLSSAAKSIKKSLTVEKAHGAWESSDDSRNKLMRVASTSKLISKVAKNADKHKDVIVSQEGEYIKMFMRGRPITMFIPSDVENYDDIRTELPPEKLKLEWVLAVHPDKIRIATGQLAGVDKDGRPLQPHVRVWDSVSLATLQVIGLGTFERGVGCLDFSKADSGTHLCVIDDSNEHMLTVWDWQRKSKIAEIKKYEKPKFVQCLAFLGNGDVLTGDSGGIILIWGKTTVEATPGKGAKGVYQISRQIKAHDGSVFTLCQMRNGMLLTGGGKDRKIILWDHDLNPEREIEVPDQYGTIRAVAEGKADQFLVGTSRNFVLRGTFNDGFVVEVQGHSSYITHLDWSPDNKYIMSNSGDYEILYWDIPSGCKLIRNRSDCKDIDWTTYTCVLGFQVFGVWPEGSDGTDINALVRSHNRKVIAVADDFCKVHLFQYPCSKPKAPSHKYSAHSSHVTNVSFTHSDGHLISTGGKDMSIIQWKLVEKVTLPPNDIVLDISATKVPIPASENALQSPAHLPQPFNEVNQNESVTGSSPASLESNLEQSAEASEEHSEEQSEGSSLDPAEPSYEEPSNELSEEHSESTVTEEQQDNSPVS